MVHVKLSIHILVGLVGWLYSKHFECHDVLVFGKSPNEGGPEGGNVPTWPLAVDWDVKHQLKIHKQTKHFKCKKKKKKVNKAGLVKILHLW